MKTLDTTVATFEWRATSMKDGRDSAYIHTEFVGLGHLGLDDREATTAVVKRPITTRAEMLYSNVDELPEDAEQAVADYCLSKCKYVLEIEPSYQKSIGWTMGRLSTEFDYHVSVIRHRDGWKIKPAWRCQESNSIQLHIRLSAITRWTSTVPVLQEDTIAGVRDWIAALEEHNLLWHMDDDPQEVFNNRLQAVELQALADAQETALAICSEKGADIFDLYPDGIFESDDALPTARQMLAERNKMSYVDTGGGQCLYRALAHGVVVSIGCTEGEAILPDWMGNVSLLVEQDDPVRSEEWNGDPNEWISDDPVHVMWAENITMSEASDIVSLIRNNKLRFYGADGNYITGE